VGDAELVTPPSLTPTPGVDPRIALATSMQAAPGVYAVLLGSGLSSAAGIPTGWQVAQDLARRVALAEGASEEALGDTPERWWEQQGRGELRYDTLLEAIAASTAARQTLLRHYFDPPPEQGGPVLPTEAHRALAWLCATRRVRLVLTTNVDRLVERALEDAGAGPQVIATTEDIAGMTPLTHADMTVIKLSGDYTSLAMRNTAVELSEYPPALQELLARALDEHGLLVVGWSGEYDSALVGAIAGCPSHRYPTFWTRFHGELTEGARRLIALRKAHVIDTAGADQFFVELTERIARLDERAARRGRPTALRVHTLMPPHHAPQGWAVLPLLQLRAATAIAPASLETVGIIGPREREEITAALSSSEITGRLHAMSSRTPASAISPDSPAPHEGLGAWQLTPEGHQSGEAASYRLGGNAAAGISALATVQLPTVGANTGSIVVALDIALSLMEPIRLADTAWLLRDALMVTAGTLPTALGHVLPADAEVTRAELHIVAATTMGDGTFRNNELESRVDLSVLGQPSRPVGPWIGFAAQVPGPFSQAEANALVADAFEHMALAAGYTDPRVGIRALRHELGVPTMD
jgi:SIR2-like domain